MRRLPELLEEAAQRGPEVPISFVGGETWTVAGLLARAQRVAGAATTRGLAPERPVLLLVDDLADFLAAFWGLVWAGLTPAPLSPPRDASEAERARVTRAAALLGGAVVVDRSWTELAGSVFDAPVLDVGDLAAGEPLPTPILTDAPAMIQLSSGSTRAPRGVILPHAALLANLDQLRARVPVSAQDVVLSWMPHTHDMGLIGCHLLPLLAGAAQVRMHPLDAMRDPRRWLQIAAQTRATVLSATPFALQRAARALRAPPDLSAVRLLAVGAEPIDPGICRDFCAATGLSTNVIYPMYGLAEATVGVAAPRAGGLHTITVDGRELPRIGPPLDGVRVEIRDAGGLVLPDGMAGELWVAGPNVSPGYWRDPEASGEVFCEGWLRTGDLAMLVEGELVVTGRLRDMVIVNGRNLHAHDLEALVEAVPGVRAAVVVPERKDGLEAPCALVVLDPAVRAAPALWAVAERLSAEVGSAARALPLERIPRTTSGKKRRAELADALASGALDQNVGDTLALVLEALSGALGRPVVEPDAPLAELGLGSIQSMDALSRVEAALGVSLDAALLRRAATPRRLAQAIEGGGQSQRLTKIPAAQEPIAIVGATCRLPGAESVSQLWERVRAGVSQIGPAPEGRFRGNFPWTGAFLSQIDRFDAARWRLDPAEAAAMDPQQRLCLELADALLAPHREEREIGVFLGLSQAGYLETLLDHQDEALPPAALPGALGSLAATRLSQHLDLIGPAMVVDTACSSALVALKLACDALRRGECRLAVAGGVHLNLSPLLWRLFQAAGALSVSGRCSPMSPEADGTVPGEGAALLLLAPLSWARASGQPILGVLRGIAVNNDGASLGVMAPNPAGQAAVLRQALAEAGVEPDRVRFVEAHAAGTPIGDPVERAVLDRAFSHRPAMGTSKAIFGHTMAAAGAVGLLRLLGELAEGELGAVSSFGFGGTNAHALVEGGARPPADRSPSGPLPPRVWLGEAPVDGLLHRVRRDPGGGLVWTALTDGPRADFAGGTYAITGGAGGIGAALARHLARRGARRLLLVGRRAAGPEHDALCARLGGLGAFARYEAVDLSDAGAAAAWVARLGRVDGVFHLAGGMDAAALGAKVSGAQALTRADAGFVVLFSSISATIPGMDRGIEAYAAANAALDRLAAAERARGRAWTALAFGPWASVGMAAGLSEAYRLAGIPPLRPEQGLSALERALKLEEAHVVITPRPPQTDAAAALPAGELLDAIRALVATAAGLEPDAVQDHVPLTTLGLDSVEALDLVKKLEKLVGRPLPSTLVFEHDTPAALAAALSAGISREAPAPPSSAPQATPGAIPLVASQQTFVVQRAFFPDMPGNVLLAVTVLGPEPRLDQARLADALRRTAARHPVLSAVIAREGAGHVLVPGRCPPELRWVDAVDLEAIADEPFDLERGPLQRVITDGRQLVLNGHHSVIDAWSQKLVLEDLLQTVEALRTGAPEPAAPASTWAEAAALLSRPPETGLDAWRARFADGVPPLILPWDAPTHAPNSGGGRQRALVLDEAETRDLISVAREAGLSLPALVLAIYMELLARWSGQPDVVVRVAHARREARLPEIERVVGSFADSLPVRATLRLDEPILDLARRVSAALAEASAGAEASSMALAGLGEHTPSGPVGLTPAGFSFPLLPAPERIGALELDEVRGAVVAGFTRIALIAWVFRGRLHTSWCAAKSHLSASKLDKLAEDFRSLVADLRASPALAPTPRSWALPGPPPETLHGRILARCRQHPDALATPTMTYGQLARRSAALASRLQGPRVAVLAAPSSEAIVGVLAVLRSGAAYVPLDPSWPDARIAAIAARAQPSAVLATPETAERAKLLGLPVYTIGAEEAKEGPDRPGAHCWVMFTSGSTGQPKGVVVTHRSALAFQEWVSRVLAVDGRDRFLYTASLGYGGSIRQIFAPLLHGAMSVPAPPDALRDPDQLLAFIRDAGVTVYNAVPSLWAHLLDAAARLDGPDPLANVRFVLIGGEAVPAALVRRWFQRHHRPGGPRLFDLYGSTETIVNATFHEIGRAPGPEEVFTPIGRPRAGVEVTLLDEALAPIPPGRREETGEIAVGGAIADGYLDDPEQTAASFLDHPMLGRLYRTGDLARRDAAGELVYVGRADTQVQIRGNRVELAEIEHALAEHPAVRQAVAVYEEGWLSVALEPRPGAEQADLRPWLERRLPAPMIPNRLSWVERVPRNPAGKVDRRATAALLRRPAEDSPPPPAPAVSGSHATLAAIWAEVLELPAPPRPDQDFFALGGDSLRAVAVADRVRARLGLELRPLLVYQHRTLGALAAALGPAATGAAGATGVGPYPLSFSATGPFPLTPVQRGFFTVHRRRPDRPPIWCASLPIHGRLDLPAFREALDLAVSRHEQLRTIYRQTSRGPLQEPVPLAPFALQYDDLSTLPPASRARALERRWEEEGEAQIALDRWPLFRVRLCKLEPERHALILVAHHITSDAYSFWLLASELIRSHDALQRGRAPELPPPVQLRDLALHERTRPDEGFWAKNLAELAQLPAPEEPLQAAHLDLGWGALDGLRSRARAWASSPYVLLLTALFQAIGDVTEADDVVVATAFSGRAGPEHPSGQVVGALARGLPVRVRGAASFEAVSRAFAAVAAHEDTDPAEIAAAVGGADALERLGRYFLTWLDPDALPLPRGSLSMDWAEARFRFAAPSTGTELMVGALAADGLTLNLHGGGLVGRVGGPLSARVRALAAPDAALIVYAPDGVVLPVTEPTLLERVDARQGEERVRSELVLLPLNAGALHPGPALEAALARAIQSSDAPVVALAGMLPALTGLCARSLGRPDQRVTTGHAATVVAMVRTVRRVLLATGRRWTDLKVGVLGYGSIGRATLELARHVLGEPAAVLLSDPRVPGADDDLLGADLILGATSGGVALDVARLRPGTVVIDDSFPRAFDEAAARARMEARGDVLLLGGGMIDAGPLERRSPWPEAAALRARYGARWLPGCHAEALLVAADLELGPTVGPVDLGRALRMWAAVEQAGWEAAPPHLGDWEPVLC